MNQLKKKPMAHKPIRKLSNLLLSISTISMLTACGGDGETKAKVQEEYERIEDQVSEITDDIKADYEAFENKLTDEEKSTAEVLESIFLPDNAKEDFEQFLDKLTPEGGKGGLYVGHFAELNDGDNNDVDVGGIYFDISEDFGGSVDARISYQQQPCQTNNTLSTDSAVKVDEGLTGKLSGSLDTLEFLDIKYIRDADIATPSLLTTFYGTYQKDAKGKPWIGSFQYQDGLGGKKLSSGEDNCNVSYTLGGKADYSTYPLSYELGALSVSMQGSGSNTYLTWDTPEDTKLVLVSQLNVNDAKIGANGYELNQIFKNGDNVFTPVTTSTSTNYAFVVQAFDVNNKLIGFDALVMDLPEAN